MFSQGGGTGLVIDVVVNEDALKDHKMRFYQRNTSTGYCDAERLFIKAHKARINIKVIET